MVETFKPPLEAIIAAMREGLRGSPDNIQVRCEIAETFVKHDRPAEAVKEYREALSRVPEDPAVKTALAYAHLLYAQLLLKDGNMKGSVEQYREAIALDPSVADPKLAKQLGIYKPNKS